MMSLSNNSGRLIGQVKKMSEAKGGNNGGRQYKYIGLSVRRDRPNSEGKYNYDYVNLTAWQHGDDPETYFSYIDFLKEDDMVEVEFTLRSSSYEKDGKRHFRLEPTVSDINALPISTLGPLKRALIGVDNADYSRLSEAKDYPFEKAKQDQVKPKQVQEDSSSSNTSTDSQNVSIDMDATLQAQPTEASTDTSNESKNEDTSSFVFVPD